jgi:3-oxoadipate enol-lactonase
MRGPNLATNARNRAVPKDGVTCTSRAAAAPAPAAGSAPAYRARGTSRAPGPVISTRWHDGQHRPPTAVAILLAMPFALHGPLRLYYESVGSGPAVLLILGQGMSAEAGYRTVDALARRFRVIVFDNRDIGRSDHSPWPYLVAQMAGDAIAVLDAARVRRARVYGISLGGMVAQELALRHPDRVERLVLGATTPGGPRAIPQDPAVLTFFTRVGAMGAEEAEWAAVPYSYAERTRREHAGRIAEDIERRLRHPTDQLAYMHQVAAAASHNTYGRLREITAPTLVIHGAQDRLQSPKNARALAEAIPRAKLTLWPDAGHMYTTDEPEADQEVARFLERDQFRRTAPATAVAA